MNDHGAALAAPGTAQQTAKNNSVSAGRRISKSMATLRYAAPRVMDKFLIEGGFPLSGTVLPAGNKNAALPALAACLLTEEDVALRNIPRIRDVEAMVELLEHLGVDVDWGDDNVLTLCAA